MLLDSHGLIIRGVEISQIPFKWNLLVLSTSDNQVINVKTPEDLP